MDGFVSNECVDRFLFFVLEMAAAAAIPVVPAEANCDAIAAGTATYCTCQQERNMKTWLGFKPRTDSLS